MVKFRSLYLVFTTSFLIFPPLLLAETLEPFADVHIHYNWTQQSITQAKDISQQLDEQNVAFAVVSSTPSALALKLAQHDKRVIPLFSPYIDEFSRRTWFTNPKVLEEAKAGFEQGLYKGIGEVHFMAGFKPNHKNKITKGLFDLAKKHGVPVLIHIDTSHVKYFAQFCQGYPEVKFLLAHAGGILGPTHIKEILSICPNTWVELSARDPWRYDRFSNEDKTIPQAWLKLIIDNPDRFMTGTDPVWSVTRTQRWDEDDEGWQHYGQLINFHRNWMKQLPDNVERKVRLTNAQSFFKK